MTVSPQSQEMDTRRLDPQFAFLRLSMLSPSRNGYGKRHSSTTSRNIHARRGSGGCISKNTITVTKRRERFDGVARVVTPVTGSVGHYTVCEVVLQTFALGLRCVGMVTSN
jgi:hypothetical protein